MRTDIPLLHNVRIASPCGALWSEMKPIDEDRVRFCDGCRKKVYNLSAMEQAEAEGLLRAHEGHLCVRYFRRHDGTILTTDCPIGLRAARQMVLTRTRVSIGLCLLLCVALASYHATVRATTGDIATESNSVETPANLRPLTGLIAMPVAPKPPVTEVKGETELGKIAHVERGELSYVPTEITGQVMSPSKPSPDKSGERIGIRVR